jgi:hypothetical protein
LNGTGGGNGGSGGNSGGNGNQPGASVHSGCTFMPAPAPFNVFFLLLLVLLRRRSTC